MSIGQPQGMLLNQFGMLLWDAFGEVAYHVGSSFTGQKTKDWRDVDVRLLLDDETWEKMALGNPENPHHNRKWRALCITFSEYGRHLTGLPIDFQLQQRTHANDKYSSKDGHLRSALVVSNIDAVPAERAGDACNDCDEAARLANSDATTPGFFSNKCAKHRAGDAVCPTCKGKKYICGDWKFPKCPDCHGTGRASK